MAYDTYIDIWFILGICTPTCQNHGTCVTSGICQCTLQWTGPSCDAPVCPPNTNDCDRPCYNGSTCGNCPDYCNCLNNCPDADNFGDDPDDALPLSYCTSTCKSCDGICYITGTPTGTCGPAYCNCLHNCSHSIPLPICTSTCKSCDGICYYTGNATGTTCDPAYCTCVHSCAYAGNGDYFAVDGDFTIDYNNAADISACNASCTASTGK